MQVLIFVTYGTEELWLLQKSVLLKRMNSANEYMKERKFSADVFGWETAGNI